MKYSARFELLVAVVLLGPFVAPIPAGAQIQELRHSVFGMDCAPCAYSLERRLDRIEGVESIDVSLNKGEALVRFARDNRVTLTDVREAIVDSGFSPETADIVVHGKLSEEQSRWILTATTGERFILMEPPESAASGARVTVLGQVAKVKDTRAEAWVIRG